MTLWEKIEDSLSTIGEALKASWVSVTAKPVSFDHMDEHERALLLPIHDSFEDKAKRGYFDEEVTKDYRKFLFRVGLEKPHIDSAVAYMHNVAASALPATRLHAKAVQDSYWQETGLRDTRKHLGRHTL